jgi:hypothetical protein
MSIKAAAAAGVNADQHREPGKKIPAGGGEHDKESESFCEAPMV